MNTSGGKRVIKTWVAALDDHPRDGRPHARRARRPQARPRVRHRGDGRAQARRVRADPHLPVPRRPGAVGPPVRDDACLTRRPSKKRRPRRRPGPRSSTSARRPTRSARCSTSSGASTSTTPATCCSSASAAPPTTVLKVLELGRRQRRPHAQHPGRRAVRLRRLRRRGPDHQAVAAPGPGPGHPHPQADVPHHDHRGPPVRRPSSSPAPARRGDGHAAAAGA